MAGHIIAGGAVIGPVTTAIAAGVIAAPCLDYDILRRIEAGDPLFARERVRVEIGGRSCGVNPLILHAAGEKKRQSQR